MPVLHQIKCISKAGPLLILRQVWAEYKEKVPKVAIKMLKHHVIANPIYQI